MENNFNVTTTENGKVAAILSYISIIGWLVAYFGLHKDKKTELSSYHLRQTLLLYIVGFILGLAQRIVFSIIPSWIYIYNIWHSVSCPVYIMDYWFDRCYSGD